MLIVAKLFMNNFFFKVLIFLSEYPFRLVRFEISTRTENRTVLSRNIGTKRNGDFFLWIWDRILNFKIPNIWNGSGYLQIPDPPAPCTPLAVTKASKNIIIQNIFIWNPLWITPLPRRKSTICTTTPHSSKNFPFYPIYEIINICYIYIYIIYMSSFWFLLIYAFFVLQIRSTKFLFLLPKR